MEKVRAKNMVAGLTAHQSKLDAAVLDIQSGFNSECGEFVRIAKKGLALTQDFPKFAGPMQSLLGGFQSRSVRMYKYKNWPAIRVLIEPLLKASRRAKSFLDLIYEKHEKYAFEAEGKLGHGYYGPQCIPLPRVGIIDDPCGQAFLEVVLVMHVVTNGKLNGEETDELIRLDSSLINLVDWARRNPNPDALRSGYRI